MCFIWQQRIKWRWRCISGQSENLLLWGTDKRLDFLMTGWKYSFKRKDISWKILSRIEFKGLPNKGRLDESESRGHYLFGNTTAIQATKINSNDIDFIYC